MSLDFDSPSEQVLTPRSLCCALKVCPTFVNIRDLTRAASPGGAVWEGEWLDNIDLCDHLPLTSASVVLEKRISRTHGDNKRSFIIWMGKPGIVLGRDAVLHWLLLLICLQYC